MMNPLTKLIVLLFLLVGWTELFATHIVGMELSYQCLNSATRQYRFTLSYSEKCPSSLTGMTQLLNFTSTSGGCAAFTATATQVGAGVDVRDQICPATTTNCSGGTFQSVKRYTLQVDVVLPVGCNWRVHTTNCCRSTLITNLQNPDTYGNYIELQIAQNTTTCNNSPTFANSPVLYACAGQLTSYNHGTIDIDGDSLAYTLIDPRDYISPYNNVPFIAGLSATNPVLLQAPTTFGFNNQTGQMTFTPRAGTAQNAIIVVRVDEFRNGVFIGSTVRELQVTVSSTCTNNNPTTSPVSGLTGASLSGNTFSACPGNTMSFSISANDIDVGQVLTATHNITANLPGSTVNIVGSNPLALSVSWPIPANPLPNYTFTITFADDACPIQGQQVLGFLVDIGANVTIVTDSVYCGPSENIPINTIANPGTFVWSPATGLSCTNCPNPTATVSAPITYTVTYTDAATGCDAVASASFTEHLMNISIGQNYTYDQRVTRRPATNPASFSFGGAQPIANNPGNLEVTLFGDFDANNETMTILNELGATVQVLGNAPNGGCAVGAIVVNIPISAANINSWAADSQIDFSTTFTNQVGLSECGGDSISMRLTYSASNPNPEWCTGDPGVVLRAELNGDPGTIITANPNKYDITPASYAPANMGAGTTVSLGDDAASAALPIGFNFTFYGNVYTNFYIVSNGFITFNAASPSGCCSGQTLPSTATPNNLIAFAWEDLDPGNGGQPAINLIRYRTIGTAPNRVLVVEFYNVDHFSSGNNVTVQAHLFETTNCIEIHTTVMPSDGGNHTMGLENDGGTIGHPFPGRNGSNWSVAAPEAYRWCPGNDTIGTGVSYLWSPSTGVSDVNSQEPTITPASSPATYTVNCDDGVCVASRDITINCTLLNFNCEDFKGVFEQESVKLSWSTTDEQDIVGYSVERSLNAIEYREVAWVPGKGNATAGHNYSLNDHYEIALGKIYYYRLMANYADGSKAQVCKVLSVSTGNAAINSVSIRPNPVQQQLEVVLHSTAIALIDIQISDVLGRVLSTNNRFLMQLGMNSFQLDLSDLPAGVYYLQIGNSEIGYTLEQVVKVEP